MAGNELELTKGTKSALALLEETEIGQRGVQLANMAQMKVWARDIAASGLAPKGMDTEGKVLLAVQTGLELGFSPMQALQSVVVVNGRATLMGDSALALVRSSGLLEPGTDIEFGCRIPVDKDEERLRGELIGWCRSQRRGKRPQETIFSWKDAQRAKLIGKAGPWTEYPQRMLQWRAIGFHFRDYWSDIGKGVVIDVEARDIPRAGLRDVTPVALEDRPASPDPLFADRPSQTILGGQREPLIVDVWEGDGPPEVDPETGEVIPAGLFD
jgi:hypothetical protein